MAKTKKVQKAETFDLSDVKARADANGCFMQMFVAYNPDTEVFVFATNDPCAGKGDASPEAALLCAIVAEHLSSLVAGKGGLPELPPDAANDGDEEPKLH